MRGWRLSRRRGPPSPHRLHLCFICVRASPPSSVCGLCPGHAAVRFLCVRAAPPSASSVCRPRRRPPSSLRGPRPCHLAAPPWVVCAGRGSSSLARCSRRKSATTAAGRAADLRRCCFRRTSDTASVAAIAGRVAVTLVNCIRAAAAVQLGFRAQDLRQLFQVGLLGFRSPVLPDFH
jgi:hypothetical protein